MSNFGDKEQYLLAVETVCIAKLKDDYGDVVERYEYFLFKDSSIVLESNNKWFGAIKLKQGAHNESLELFMDYYIDDQNLKIVLTEGFKDREIEEQKLLIKKFLDIGVEKTLDVAGTSGSAF